MENQLIISRDQAIDKIVNLRSKNQFGETHKKWSSQKKFDQDQYQELGQKSNEELNDIFQKTFPDIRQYIQPKIF